MKQAALIISIILLFGIGYYIFGMNTDQNTAPNQANESSAMEETDSTMEENNDTSMEMSDTDDEASNLEGRAMFTIQPGSTATYIAQKEFLSRPTEQVEGVTTAVQGTIIAGYDVQADENVVSANATITPNFDSKSEGRDNEVEALFNGDIEIAVSTATELDLTQPNTLTDEVSILMTINGVTNPVPTPVTIISTGERLTVTGQAQISLEEFNINAPSAVGIYTVNDTMGISFSITASR